MLNRKTVAEAFWNAELEDKLCKRGWIDRLFKIMQEIDHVRAATVYPHDICSDECRKRGKYA